jgi:hypothetical protein
MVRSVTGTLIEQLRGRDHGLQYRWNTVSTARRGSLSLSFVPERHLIVTLSPRQARLVFPARHIYIPASCHPSRT